VIYAPPALAAIDEEVIALIDAQKERLRIYTQHSPRRWSGSLRRSTFARAIRGSNTIEGYNATLDEAIAVIENEPPLDERTETWLAIKGYRDALTYITQASQDSTFEFTRQFLKSLHFLMMGFDMSKYPGQWRPGSIFIVNQPSGETVYEGPDVEQVNGLMGELVAYLSAAPEENVLVRGAMAHLNLTMIHPFKDGNGRMARALQTFVLAREGILHPVFSSIEEWLGRNTEAYYAILAQTGQGSWRPEGDALPWVRFCLKAHFQQAATLIRRNEEYERLYAGIVPVLEGNKLPQRMAMPLFDAALGFRLTNARYRADAEVSEMVASRDLRRLCDLKLLSAHGANRGRVYSAGEALRLLRSWARLARRLEDPYHIVAERQDTHRQAETPLLPGF
jgi:Fic family protein